MSDHQGPDVKNDTKSLNELKVDEAAGDTGGEAQVVPELDPKAERKVVAKLDLFLTPILFIIYLCCFIDRANIGMLSAMLPGPRCYRC